MNVRRGKVSKRAVLNVIATLASFGLMLIPIFQASSLFPAEKWTPVFSLVIGILNLVLLQVSNGDVRFTAPKPPRPKRVANEDARALDRDRKGMLSGERREIIAGVKSVLPPAEVAEIDQQMEQDDT